MLSYSDTVSQVLLQRTSLLTYQYRPSQILYLSCPYLAGWSFTNTLATTTTGICLGLTTRLGLDPLTTTSGSALRKCTFWPVPGLTVWELRWRSTMTIPGTRPSTGHSRSVTSSTTNIDWKCLDTAEKPATRCSMKTGEVSGITRRWEWSSLAFGRVLVVQDRWRDQRQISTGGVWIQRRRRWLAAVWRNCSFAVSQRHVIHDIRPGQRREERRKLCRRSPWWLVVQQLLLFLSHVQQWVQHMVDDRQLLFVRCREQNDDHTTVSEQWWT